MSPSEVQEIESSSPDPVVTTGSSVFNREKAKQMIQNIYPDADVTTVEACLSLSVYRQITKVPLPKSDDDVVQQINDLLNEDAASTKQPEDPLDAHSMEVVEQETFKTPRIVCSPEAKEKGCTFLKAKYLKSAFFSGAPASFFEEVLPSS